MCVRACVRVCTTVCAGVHACVCLCVSMFMCVAEHVLVTLKKSLVFVFRRRYL